LLTGKIIELKTIFWKNGIVFSMANLQELDPLNSYLAFYPYLTPRIFLGHLRIPSQLWTASELYFLFGTVESTGETAPMVICSLEK